MNTQSTPILVVTADGARITLREKETNAPCAEMWLGRGGREEARNKAFAIARACDLYDELIAVAKLAAEFWYSDHPNDTAEAHAARQQLNAVLAKAALL